MVSLLEVLQDWSGTLTLPVREQNACSKVLRAGQLLVLSQRVIWTRIHIEALPFRHGTVVIGKTGPLPRG